MARHPVVAILFGPPCETWSIARSCAILGVTKCLPPERAGSDAWGTQESAQKRQQLAVGSRLLQTGLSLCVDATRAGLSMCLEHPAPLKRHVDFDAPTIWALPETLAFLADVKATRVDTFHEDYGKKSPKPTSCLVHRVPHFQQFF